MTDITRRKFVRSAALAPLALAPLALSQSVAKSDRFDIVVAGAGHNSLAAACYLSKAGYRCLVLEGRPMLGGGTKTAELTLRGFHHDVCSSDHQFIQDNPLLRNDELHLKDYGLEYIYPDPVYHVPFPDGSYITQWQDLDRTVEEFAKFSKKDAGAYRRMVKEVEAIRPLLRTFTYSPIGFTKPLSDLIAEHPQGKFWRRRMVMSAWDILHDNSRIRTASRS
jgi:phytoene dehydrogenase-like protein